MILIYYSSIHLSKKYTSAKKVTAHCVQSPQTVDKVLGILPRIFL